MVWRKGVAGLVVVVWMMTLLLGCATTPEGQQEQQAAATGGLLGAAAGGLIGYMVGGEKGALIGAAAGAALGALSAWAYEKRQQAIREAAAQNRVVEYVKEDRTERVIAEPVNQGKIFEEDGKKVKKVKVRTYKRNPQTKKEELTSDTIERVPVEG